MTSLLNQMRCLNPQEIHKLIIDEYLQVKSLDTTLERDQSKDRTDYDVIKQNHQFLWDDKNKPETWEQQFAKKYYEKLFKEYCLADLTRYKENKVALRWRIEKEVVSGKGQFICGNKPCGETQNLRSWEVNFSYQEKQERKNALVKIRLCPSCSKKLNYHSKKRELKRIQRKDKHESKGNVKSKTNSLDSDEILKPAPQPSKSHNLGDETQTEESPWATHKPVEVKSREEEIEEYLQDLLL